MVHVQLRHSLPLWLLLYQLPTRMSVSGEDGLKKDSGSHQIQTSESPSASHVSVKNDSSMTVTDAPNFSALKLLGPA